MIYPTSNAKHAHSEYPYDFENEVTRPVDNFKNFLRVIPLVSRGILSVFYRKFGGRSVKKISLFNSVTRMNDDQPHLLGPMDDHLEIPDLDNLRKQRYLRNQNVMKVRKWAFLVFFCLSVISRQLCHVMSYFVVKKFFACNFENTKKLQQMDSSILSRRNF